MIQALAYHVWRWPGPVLRPYSDRMQQVPVGVGDKNRPCGGVGKFCRIQVHLNGAPVALIEDAGADLYAVIDRAIDRIGRVIGRNLDHTHRVRDATRCCHEIHKPTHAHGDIK